MAKKTNNNNNNGKRLTSPQSLNGAIKNICDIMRRSNCAGALQYVPELTWILFLRILDEREQHEAEASAAVGVEFSPSLEPPYRWRDWAAPNGLTRRQLESSTLGAFFNFVNKDLIPYLKSLKDRPNATARQKVISEIFSGIERTRIDTERNLLDVLDKVNEISAESVDPTHIFTLSQVYEGLLLKMGEKGNDGGQFFTPRQVIRAMVQVIDPRLGETVYDPCCGTGGFLAQAYEHMAGPNHEKIVSADQLEMLKRHTFYGREKDNAIYPIALANLMLHGIDEPHIWHGNTLTGAEIYGGLYQNAPTLFDVVLTNPPFGGKEGQDAQTRFAYKTSSTQVLFLQHVIDSLKPGGRCGIVLDEGVLFRTNECDLWCIVSLPPGTFVNAGAGVKTNLLFFTKGNPTERIWYYELLPPPWKDRQGRIRPGTRFTIKYPLTLSHFEEFFRLLPSRADSEHSWTVSRQEIEARQFDLKAVNPHRKDDQDTRTPEELIALIRQKGQQVEQALMALEGR